MIKYCTRCWIPSTKPHITFDSLGVCNACNAHDKKETSLDGINWDARSEAFKKLVLEAKNKKAPFFDVVVPVSGGKDSITQIHRLLPYELRILAVNVDYGIKTPIGEKNLNCIPQMGASLSVFKPEPKLNQKLIRIGFEHYGDPDLLSHTMLHAFPLHTAINFKVPLLLHGENSAFEYGGEKSVAKSCFFTKEWFNNYAANMGRDAYFVSREHNIPIEKLKLYQYPEHNLSSRTKAVFMSHFFRWDSNLHLKIAKSYGFQCLSKAKEGTYRNFVGIDEKINRIHQYLKVLKFGYGRATDHACEDIRNRIISKEDARELIQKYDLVPLSDYYIKDFIDLIDMKKSNFLSTLEKYRNRDLWKQKQSGDWYIENHLNLNL